MGKDLSALASYFRPQVDEFLGACEAAGILLTVIDVDRTPAEQQQKLADGVSWTTHSKHLPQPPEGKSEAIDVCPTVYLSQKGWGPGGPLWAQIGAIGEKIGMRWGGRFPHPDLGHLEFHGQRPVMGVDLATQI